MRMKQKILFFVFAAALNAPLSTLAQKDQHIEKDSPLQAASFRVEQWTVLQGSGDFYSGMLHWRPSYRFSDEWSASVSAGIGYLQRARGEGFAVLTLHGSVAYRFGRFSVETGPGMQIWGDEQGSYFAIRSNFLFHFDWPVFDHAYAGWSELFGEKPETREYHFGIGFVF